VDPEEQDGSPRSLSVVHAVRSDAFAGVERYVASVADALAVRGHRVTVVGGDVGVMRAAIGNQSVELLPGSKTRGVALALGRHGRHSDVVHVHMTAAEVAALAAWPVVRAPTIATRHFAQRRGSSLAGRAISPLIARMLVEEGTETAGFAICKVHPGDAELGWIQILGVRPRWRGRGVGRALLLTAFGAFRTRGLTRAGLGVDAENPTGATRLYESVGMRASDRFELYEKRLA